MLLAFCSAGMIGLRLIVMKPFEFRLLHVEAKGDFVGKFPGPTKRVTLELRNRFSRPIFFEQEFRPQARTSEGWQDVEFLTYWGGPTRVGPRTNQEIVLIIPAESDACRLQITYCLGASRHYYSALSFCSRYKWSQRFPKFTQWLSERCSQTTDLRHAQPEISLHSASLKTAESRISRHKALQHPMRQHPQTIRQPGIGDTSQWGICATNRAAKRFHAS